LKGELSEKTGSYEIPGLGRILQLRGGEVYSKAGGGGNGVTQSDLELPYRFKSKSGKMEKRNGKSMHEMILQEFHVFVKKIHEGKTAEVEFGRQSTRKPVHAGKEAEILSANNET